MKKIILTLFVFAFIANVSAQFKVNSLGQIGIGCDPTGDAFRIYNTTMPNFLLQGSNGKLEIGISMFNGSFCDFAQAGDIVYRPLSAGGRRYGLIFFLPNNNNNNDDGNQYFKFGDVANGGWFSLYNNRKAVIDGNVGIGKTPTLGMLDVNGSIYSIGNIVLTSDERLKREIKLLSKEKDRLYLLQGKSYIKTTPPSNIKDVRYDEKTGKELPVVEKREVIEYQEYGFLAQELEEVFPDLVTQDSDGYYGVNYIGLIPVIVEALKDQRLEIEKQQEQIKQTCGYKTDDFNEIKP